jgi:hypothetical protein
MVRAGMGVIGPLTPFGPHAPLRPATTVMADAPGRLTDLPFKYLSMEETMTNETGQTRRIVLGGLAASAGLLSMIDETTAQAQTSGKTFVLVHGAWHGGWCWRRVSDLLEKKGHKVFTPTSHALAVLRHEGIEEHETADRLGHLLGDAGNDGTAIGVADQHDIAEALPLDHVHDVGDVSDMWRD